MAERTTATDQTTSMEETKPAMVVDTGDHGIANLEIQCNSLDIGETNHHPGLAHNSNESAAVGSDTHSLVIDALRLDPTTAAMGLSSPTTDKLPAAVSVIDAKQGSEFQSHMLPSTTSTTESTTTTTVTSDCFVSVASSTVNVSSSTMNSSEAPLLNPTGTEDAPPPGNNTDLTIPTSIDSQTKAKPIETSHSSATTPAADAEPLGQSTIPPPQSSSMMESTITVDGNETKEGIQETVAAKPDSGADQAAANATGQEGPSQDQPLQQQDAAAVAAEGKEKQGSKDRKDDLSVDTPPIPLEVSSHINEENSEYDEELEFDASDDSSEGQLSSDDEEDYTIDPNDFQMGENEPVIIIGVPSMQDTEPSQ